jgi:2,3,4,5-tetrahydropyridine-2,6-dicarboxylate N-succinyltransferase
MTDQLSNIIDAAWDARDDISSATQGEVRDAVQAALNGLDDGSFRVAEKLGGEWLVNQWLKKAVLLSFRLNDNVVVDGGASGAPANSPDGARTGSARQAFASSPARWHATAAISQRMSS